MRAIHVTHFEAHHPASMDILLDSRVLAVLGLIILAPVLFVARLLWVGALLFVALQVLPLHMTPPHATTGRDSD